MLGLITPIDADNIHMCDLRIKKCAEDKTADFLADCFIFATNKTS